MDKRTTHKLTGEERRLAAVENYPGAGYETAPAGSFGYAGPTGRERGGEHWNARLIREEADRLRRDEEYRAVREALYRAMADRDDWDGDEDEATILVRLIEHMSRATHGTCGRCRQSIQATQPFDIDHDAAGRHRQALDEVGLFTAVVDEANHLMHAPLCPAASSPAVPA
jgi:hypothetical protein